MNHPIGTTADGQLITLPEDAITQGFAILARRRSGKSTLAGVMEETFCERGDPWVALDPVSAHKGILYKDDNGQPGKPSGYDVLIVGGKDGHVPLDERAGAQLAEIIVDTDISCVIDLGDESMNATQLFVTAFANELLKLNQTPRHVIFEEAHELVPQQLVWDNQKLVRGACSRLIRNGGGRGIGFTLVSQRPAAVAKDVLEMIDNLFILRMSGPNDLKAVQAWFEHNVGDKEELQAILRTLPAFKPGEAWLCSPDWMHQIVRLQVRERETYHAGRTPKRGEKPVQLKRVELGKVIEQFRSAAEKRQLAVTEERDLKTRLKDLERQLAAAKKHAPPGAAAPPSEELIERRVHAALTANRAERKQHERVIAGLVQHVERAGASLRSSLDGYIGSVARLTETICQNGNGATPMPNARSQVSEKVTTRLTRHEMAQLPPARSAAPAGVVPTDDGSLPAGAARMLRELASRHPLTWTQAQLGGLTGFSYKGGTFRTYRGILKRYGFIDLRGREIAITDAGLDAAGEVPESPTDHESAMAMWSEKLPAGAYRMLLLVAAANADGITQDELAEQSDFERAGGTFRTYRGILKRNGLIELDGERVLACDILWPEGEA